MGTSLLRSVKFISADQEIGIAYSGGLQESQAETAAGLVGDPDYHTDLLMINKCRAFLIIYRKAPESYDRGAILGLNIRVIVRLNISFSLRSHRLRRMIVGHLEKVARRVQAKGLSLILKQEDQSQLRSIVRMGFEIYGTFREDGQEYQRFFKPLPLERITLRRTQKCYDFTEAFRREECDVCGLPAPRPPILVRPRLTDEDTTDVEG